jgi:transcriptional regulator with XRE-family HTH domain
MITVKQPELKNTMVRQGYTGAGLARATGISQAYIVYILQGKRSILPPTAKKISDALRCDFDDVFEISEGAK